MSDKETRKIILKAIKDQEIEAMVFTTAVYNTEKKRDDKEKLEFQNAIEVYFADVHLMIDAHMHIQSLNITPMTLQWSTAYLATEGKAFVEQHQKGSTRREMNDMTVEAPGVWIVHDFGRIGRLPTDLVGKVFMCDAENNDFRRDLYWILGADEETSEEAAGEDAQLENLSGRGADRYSDNFYKNVAYYFKNNKVLSQYIVLMMDLSYAHYWGKWYLPINLPMPFDSDRGFYFINDSIQISKKSTKSGRVMILDVDPRRYFPDPEEDRRIPLLYNVNLEEEFERFLIYIKSFLGLSDEKPEPFYLYFDTDTHAADALLAMKIQSDIDKEHAENLLQSLEDTYRPVVSRRYKHFLEPIPGDNGEIFEDFWKQCDHTMACALSYPLQFFTFYHYDPRRHYIGSKNYEMGKDNHRPLMKVDELKNSHAFFTYRIAHKEFNFFEDDRNTVHRGQFLHINPLSLDDMSYTDPKETYFDRLIKDHALESVGKSSGNIKANPEVFPMINSKTNKGLFWGIKMYPALGYIPDDFTNYPHLRDFYQTCIKEEIPIMIHSSPLGMTIADPQNYIHYDRDFKEGRLNSLKSQILRAEELYNHPQNWKNVLTTYSELKICLAHFGGESLWTHPPEEVRAVDDKPDTRRVILDMIDEFPNVYTDIACFSKANAGKVAKHLTKALQTSQHLRKRLMMGSDWYMMVPDMKDAPSYYNKMFKMFKQMSKELGYDAWYEFTVVNPLRYLGLIDSEADMDDTKIIMDKVYGFRDVAREKVKDDELLKYYDITEKDLNRIFVCLKEKDELKESESEADSLLIQLKKISIMKAEEIKLNGKLLILTK